MNLLPSNSTPAERAIAESIARVSDVPVPIRDTWNPETCPVELLPWLAWTLSVEAWDASWEDFRKRAVIKSAVDTARTKGTRMAVSEALAALGASVVMTEWFELDPPGTRFPPPPHLLERQQCPPRGHREAPRSHPHQRRPDPTDHARPPRHHRGVPSHPLRHPPRHRRPICRPPRRTYPYRRRPCHGDRLRNVLADSTIRQGLRVDGGNFKKILTRTCPL
jgi:phage tail P2-like protein